MCSVGQAHFEARPQDLHLLRHDKPLHQSHSMPHLKHVPSYLLPEGARPKPGKVWAPFHKEKRKDRGGPKGKRKEKDPLKSFTV